MKKRNKALEPFSDAWVDLWEQIFGGMGLGKRKDLVIGPRERRRMIRKSGHPRRDR